MKVVNYERFIEFLKAVRILRESKATYVVLSHDGQRNLLKFKENTALVDTGVSQEVADYLVGEGYPLSDWLSREEIKEVLKDIDETF